MIKYSASPVTATFEHDGTRITFAVPIEKELFAHGAYVHSIVGDHFDLSGDVPVIKYDEMPQDQIEKFFVADLEFIARKIVSFENLETEGEPNQWGIAERVAFLSWLDANVPSFGDFCRKLTTQKKRTSAVISPSSQKTSGTKASA